MNTYKKIFLLLFTGSVLGMAMAGPVQAQQQQVDAVLQKAREAGIDASTLTELQQRASSQGISDGQLVALIQPAIDMAAQNLPGEYALEKAMEGLSKGIPSSRIAPVLQRMKQTSAEAAAIIDPWLEQPEVQAMIGRSSAGIPKETFRNELTRATSRAFTQDVSQENIQTLFDQMGTEAVLGQASPPDIIAAVGILPDMPQQVDQSRAGKVIVRALKGGFKANELQNLPSAVTMAQQRNELPAASVMEGVSKQLKGGVPAKQILQNLLNGEIGGPPGDAPKGLENRPDQGNKGQGNNGNS